MWYKILVMGNTQSNINHIALIKNKNSTENKPHDNDFIKSYDEKSSKKIIKIENYF